MVITKHEDVTKQGFCKILLRELHLRGSLKLVLILFGVVAGREWALIYLSVGCGAIPKRYFDSLGERS